VEDSNSAEGDYQLFARTLFIASIQSTSQWHIKRYTSTAIDDPKHSTANNTDHKTRDKNRDLDNNKDHKILLEMHTDPSLISVVIHDCPGINDGAMGLQYYCPSRQQSLRQNDHGAVDYKPSKGDYRELELRSSEWIECNGHGHAIATVFVGSFLAHLTCNVWRGCKHRVIDCVVDQNIDQQTEQHSRMAATLFVRPKPSLLMQPLPSPVLLLRSEQQAQRQRQPVSSSKHKVPVTFNDWLKRVARNYETRKKKKSENKRRSDR
jgi:isopenicillin N synthase-like dioxygenase